MVEGSALNSVKLCSGCKHLHEAAVLIVDLTKALYIVLRSEAFGREGGGTLIIKWRH